MRSVCLILLVCCYCSWTTAQYPGASPPWGQARPSLSGKPNRPSPFGSSSSSNSKQTYSSAQYDDPIPPSNSRLDQSSYDTQTLPAKLPIQAPNGVVEIYNRVVDDLLKRLQVEFRKREIDPMDVVIRPTPGGPVRVPGHLQKRPFRRPGAALYRTSFPLPQALPKQKLAKLGGKPSLSKPPFKKSVVPNKHPYKRARSNDETPASDDLPPSTRFPVDRPVVSSGEVAEAAVSTAEGGAVENKASFRGAGKISKTPLGEDDEKDALLPETTTAYSTTTFAAENKTEAPSTTAAPPVEDESSEEDEPFFSRARSDEYAHNEDEAEIDLDAALDELEEKEHKKTTEKLKKGATKKEGTDEELDEEDEAAAKDKAEGSKDVETLLQKYQNKNTDKAPPVGATKTKYAGNPNKKKDGLEKKNKTKQSSKEQLPPAGSTDDDDEEDFDDSDRSDDDDDDDMPHDLYHDGLEPGTLQSGGNRPNGGYYPPGGPPAIPAKPNAQLTGLSKIRRASDVAVSVDARSAVITARLLVGPLNVVINDSVEPLERNVRATIPELEAEILLMERHGVVFLQRFTLDRAYGQDVEISIPKMKGDSNKKKKLTSSISGGSPPLDAMNSGAQQRYQTKMAAHVSMEIVKLLRSGNLRVNLMRTAQASMSKLKLPIQKPKKAKKKSAKKNSKSNIETSDTNNEE